MKDVLFICKSNINRSQQAEAFYNHLTQSNKAISAGIKLEEDLQKPSKKGIQIMLEKGINISKQKSKLVNKKMLKDIKKVIVICPKSFIPDYILKFDDVEFWKIKDPHHYNMEERRKIRDQIEQKVKKLTINKLF